MMNTHIVLLLFTLFIIWLMIGFNKTQFDKYKDKSDKKLNDKDNHKL